MVGEMMKQNLLDFCTDETAAASVEYGILVATISIAVIGGATILGGGWYKQGLWWTFYRLAVFFETGCWYDVNGMCYGGSAW